MPVLAKAANTKKSRMPSLRFHSFQQDFKLFKLSGLVEFKSGGTPRIENTEYWDGDIPWISAASMTEKFCTKSERTLTAKGVSNGSRIAPCGSLLLLVRGSMLYNKVPIGIVISDVAFNQDVKALIPGEHTTTEYLYQWMTSKEDFLLGKVVGTGIGAGKLDTNFLKDLNVSLPSPQEQQKIASFLSSVDEKIRQLTRKEELLEQYKKGVMQQLFSGKLRFKDEKGKSYPKWEEKLYGDIFSFYPTNSFSRENLNYESGDVKNIHYGDIHTKFSVLFDITRELVPYVNKNVKVKEENYCKEGDLVVADASEDYADIGKTIELVRLNEEKVVAGLHTFLARPNKMNMYKGFSGYLVQASYVRKQVMTIAQGTKVLSLSPTRLGKVRLNVPSIEEQRKIARYLSNIDTKIEMVIKLITQTQTFKKGLLQQMFV
jgi:type I restriction enzyme, S subunit